MPYRQKKEYVHKAIKSVMGQTYKKFELIIIFDDEKKDDLNFIKSITKNKKKIKIIINKKNIGAGASRNKGIKKAKGKYIAFIDSDDFWKPNKLEKQIEFIKSNKYNRSRDFTTLGFVKYEKFRKKWFKFNRIDQISKKVYFA